MTDLEIAKAIEDIVRKRIPQWKSIPKAKSTFHQVISYLPPIVFLRKAYMNNFATTIGYTYAYPPGGEDNIDTGGHEGKHGLQQKKWSRALFSFLYLFPQAFLIPLGILLAFLLNPWWLAVSVAGLLPLPAPFRMIWELQAYEISVMIYTWRWGNAGYYAEWIDKKAFKGISYYFMWPFGNYVEKRLLKAIDRAKNWENIEKKDDYVNEIFLLLKKANVLKAPEKR